MKEENEEEISINLEEGYSKSRRRNKISSTQRNLLTSLLQSILPVIIDRVIWNLPTTIEAVEISKVRNQSNHNNIDDSMLMQDFFKSSSLFQATSLHAKMSNKTRNDAFVDVSASALHGNAHLLSQLLDLVGIISLLLGDDAQLFLPIILLPFVEKTSSYGNHPHVKQSASKNLGRVAQALDIRSVPELLLSNFDYLTDSLSTQLRCNFFESTNHIIRGKHDTLDVVEALLENAFFHRLQASDDKLNSSFESFMLTDLPNSPNDTHRRLLHTLMNSLLIFFDTHIVSNVNISSRLIRNLHAEEKDTFTLAMVRVLGLIFKTLKVYYRKPLVCNEETHVENPLSREKAWLDTLLLNFRKGPRV